MSGLVRNLTIRMEEQNKLEIIKELVANEVDLNLIGRYKLVSDYLPQYKGTEKDFKIGKTLACAKKYYNDTRGKLTAFAKELIKLGFNVENREKFTTRIRKKQIAELVKVVDLNKIETLDKVSDYLPQYKNTEEDYSIGISLNNVRATHKRGESIGTLGEIYVSFGLNLSNKRIRKSAKEICETFDKIVEHGIRLEDIKAYQMLSEVLPNISSEEDFCVGQTLSMARRGRAGEIIKNKLISLNFDFSKKLEKHNKKIDQESKTTAI